MKPPENFDLPPHSAANDTDVLADAARLQQMAEARDVLVAIVEQLRDEHRLDNTVIVETFGAITCALAEEVYGLDDARIWVRDLLPDVLETIADYSLAHD